MFTNLLQLLDKIFVSPQNRKRSVAWERIRSIVTQLEGKKTYLNIDKRNFQVHKKKWEGKKKLPPVQTFSIFPNLQKEKQRICNIESLPQLNRCSYKIGSLQSVHKALLLDFAFFSTGKVPSVREQFYQKSGTESPLTDLDMDMSVYSNPLFHKRSIASI